MEIGTDVEPPANDLDESEELSSEEIGSEVGGGPPDDDPAGLSDTRVALIGRFGGMTQREVAAVLRSYGASVVDADARGVDRVIIGADESPLAVRERFPPSLAASVGDGDTRVVPEADLWRELGLVDREQDARQYYTPAMLADILGVSVRVVRRWHRLGLIRAARTLHRLPYFDFAEVATARRLATWVASGASPRAIERHLADLVGVLPDIRRPLDQLSILVEGRNVLLRHGEGLVEPGGQMRFDFESPTSLAFPPEDDEPRAVIGIWEDPMRLTDAGDDAPEDPILEAAFDAEDAGDIDAAIDHCRTILARDGGRADVNFQLAELLYRGGDVSAARERYSVAVELEPDMVEARASLGNVLAEAHQDELAIAAYRGALSLHEDYADVHFNLARALERTGRDDDAVVHWRRFLQLSPRSPWADEARGRLEDP